MTSFPLPVRPRTWARVSLAALAALGIVGASFTLPAPALGAAVERATTASIDSLDFTSETVASGSSAEIRGTWSLPDHPTVPAGFTLALPPELAGRSDGFPLLDPQGAVMGRCVVDASTLECTFAADYLTAHPENLHGTFFFWVTVRNEPGGGGLVTYDVGGHTLAIDVQPSPDPGTGTGPGVCTENCAFPGRGAGKWGMYDAAAGTIVWVVQIGSGRDGLSGGEVVTVTDVLAENQELLAELNGVRYAELWSSPRLVTGADGRESPGAWAPVDRSTYAATDRTVTFTAQAGHYYDVRFAARVTDQGVAGRYENRAEISIAGASDTAVTGQVVRHGGGGTGGGQAPAPSASPTPVPSATPVSSATPVPSATPTPIPAPTPIATPTPSVVAAPAPLGLSAHTGGTVSTESRLMGLLVFAGLTALLAAIGLAVLLTFRSRARR